MIFFLRILLNYLNEVKWGFKVYVLCKNSFKKDFVNFICYLILKKYLKLYNWKFFFDVNDVFLLFNIYICISYMVIYVEVILVFL